MKVIFCIAIFSLGSFSLQGISEVKSRRHKFPARQGNSFLSKQTLNLATINIICSTRLGCHKKAAFYLFRARVIGFGPGLVKHNLSLPEHADTSHTYSPARRKMRGGS